MLDYKERCQAPTLIEVQNISERGLLRKGIYMVYKSEQSTKPACNPTSKLFEVKNGNYTIRNTIYQRTTIVSYKADPSPLQQNDQLYSPLVQYLISNPLSGSISYEGSDAYLLILLAKLLKKGEIVNVKGASTLQ